MSDSKQSSTMPEKDYEAIRAAVMETARGRWFLQEFAARNRNSDTAMVLDALKKFETAAVRPEPELDTERIKFDLMDMATAIAETKNEIAALQPEEDQASRFGAATEELDAIVEATETATGEILGSAESIQELAWILREAGADEETCDKLDQLITDIYTACSFQDITGQRTTKIVNVLKYLEDRVMAMVGIWGGDKIAPAPPPPDTPEDSRPDAHLLNGPQLSGQGTHQDDIDLMFVDARQETTPDAALTPDQLEETPEAGMADPEEATAQGPATDMDDTALQETASPDMAIGSEKTGDDGSESPISEQPVSGDAANPGQDASASPADDELSPASLDRLDDADKLALFS